MARQAAHSVAAQAPMEDLSVFYKVEVPDERMDELRAQLAKNELVEAAFVKPAVELPRINDMAAAPEEPPPATPDLSARQIYLNAAPSGIDARWAWTQAGGRGTRHPHHRRRGQLALHARGSHAEPGRRRRRHPARRRRLAQPRHRGPGRVQRRREHGRHRRHRRRRGRQRGIPRQHRLRRGHQPGGVAAPRRRHHPARDAPPRPALRLRDRAPTSAATSPSSGGPTTSPRS